MDAERDAIVARLREKGYGRERALIVVRQTALGRRWVVTLWDAAGKQPSQVEGAFPEVLSALAALPAA